MGTALASHTIRSIIDLSMLWGWSLFVLFVGLTKAFDRLIREFVVGWPDGLSATERASYLEGIGVDPNTIASVIHMIETVRPLSGIGRFRHPRR